MRVPDSTLTRQVVNSLRQSRRELAELQAQLASGRRFTRPSEAPRSAARALVLRNSLDTLERYQEGVEGTVARLNVVEATLANLTQLLQDALELATAGGNGTLTAADRTRLAAQVEQVTEAAFELANSSWTGRYLFGGHLTATPPYRRDSVPEGFSYTYLGDHGELTREVAPGQTVTLNLPGDTIFQAPLETMEGLRRALAANDPPALAGAAAALQDALEQCLHHRAGLGVKIAHLELSAERMGDTQHAYRGALSREEDVDFALAVASLHTREAAYQASLSVGARLLQPSLLDYLR